jgi:hypothetical protein
MSLKALNLQTNLDVITLVIEAHRCSSLLAQQQLVLSPARLLLYLLAGRTTVFENR